MSFSVHCAHCYMLLYLFANHVEHWRCSLRASGVTEAQCERSNMVEQVNVSHVPHVRMDSGGFSCVFGCKVEKALNPVEGQDH